MRKDKNKAVGFLKILNNNYTIMINSKIYL
jgi:hypothetical protein